MDISSHDAFPGCRRLRNGTLPPKWADLWDNTLELLIHVNECTPTVVSGYELLPHLMSHPHRTPTGSFLFANYVSRVRAHL